jgi:hypothetical protein
MDFEISHQIRFFNAPKAGLLTEPNLHGSRERLAAVGDGLSAG